MERPIEYEFNPEESVYVANPEALKKKIEKMVKDGPQNLRIFTDFDFTLSKRIVKENIKGDSAFKIVQDAKIFGNELYSELNTMREKYCPIEKDPHMPIEEKAKYMLEWWKRTQEVLVKAQITKEQLRLAVVKSNLYLRAGVIELFKTVKEANSKVYVVSAGMRGVVTETFYIVQAQEVMDLIPHIEYCMTPEIYDANNVIIGFPDPSITTSNKNHFVTHGKYKDINKGVNAIVMGDMVEDIKMIADLDCGEKISVGFYNYKESSNPADFQKYMEIYDIVLTNDGNMTHIAELVKLITGQPLNPSYENLGPSCKAFAHYLKK